MKKTVVQFGPFTGRHLYHSAVLEHVDNDMKRPFEIEGRDCMPGSSLSS